MANTARPAPPAVVTLCDQRPAPNLPAELASAVLVGVIFEGRFAIRSFGPEMASPGAARDFTRHTLQAWALGDLADDASVIVSELVTNALRHGLKGHADAPPASVELILCWAASMVFCVVTDPGASPPVLADPDPAAEAGRGLHVVEALACDWGWGMLDPARKAVWASLCATDPYPGF
jgi:anti-sigma regulatory factor (Ser/Thr protein kinase)